MSAGDIAGRWDGRRRRQSAPPRAMLGRATPSLRVARGDGGNRAQHQSTHAAVQWHGSAGRQRLSEWWPTHVIPDTPVSYATVDGTATGGPDYVAAEGTLRFEPGDTARTLTVATLTDNFMEGAETFTMELRNPSGATIADGTGTATINDEEQRRIGLVDDVVLPEVGRALAFSAVRCRIDAALANSAGRSRSPDPSSSLALVGSHALTGVTEPASGLMPYSADPFGRRPPAAGSPLTLEQAFDDSLILMQSQEQAEGDGRFAAWWCPDYQNLGGGSDGEIAWDGEISSWHVGADARIAPGLLAGVSFSRSRGAFDYRGGGRSLDAGQGTYEVGLVSIHPYLAWSVLPELDVWGTAGHGWGMLRIVDAAAGQVLTSPTTLDSGVVGMNGRILTRGTATVRLKGEWALAQMDVAHRSAVFDAKSVDMQRLRFGAEVSFEHALADGTSLIPWGEVGLRHDGGDGETGAGLETGGGIRYLHPEAGLTVEGHGRWLTMHRGTLREWGFGGLIRFAPRRGGRGPSVSLMPTWGETVSGVRQLWERGATNPYLHGAAGARLDAEFAYGFAALQHRGVLTPYGALSLAAEAARGYRFGGRLAVSRSATVSLEAERRAYVTAMQAHSLTLLGTVGF